MLAELTFGELTALVSAIVAGLLALLAGLTTAIVTVLSARKNAVVTASIEKKVDHTINLSNGHYRELLDEIAVLKKARFVLSGTETDAVEATAAQEKVDRADAIPSLVRPPVVAPATSATAAAATAAVLPDASKPATGDDAIGPLVRG